MGFGGYDAGFQEVVAAAAQAVEIRGMAAYWLLAERNRDLVASLSDMRKGARESWIRQDVLPSYEEVKLNIALVESKINYSEHKLHKAIKNHDKRTAEEAYNELLIFGESYLYWKVLLNACRDIFDAVWRLGITVPVPDFEDDTPTQRGGGLMALLDSRASGLNKKAKAGAERMDKKAKTARKSKKIGEYSPIEREEDPRRRPLDTVNNIKVEDFEDEEDEESGSE
jgi:hypothetical protein